MPPSYPIWSSGSTDAMVPQIYNWASADRGEQANNIQRRTAWDAQAINNAQNYFQIQQQQEAQDYARRQAVQQENYNRQQQAEREALARYKFAEDQKLSRDYLTKQDEWAQAKQATTALNENFKNRQEFQKAQDDSKAWLREQLMAGKYLDTPVDQLAEISGLEKEQAASMQAEHRKDYPEKAFQNVRMELAQMRVKDDPAKFKDPARLDSLENYLKMKLPPELRGKVYLDRDKLDLVRTDYRFTPSRGVQMQQQSYSNPGSGPAVNYNFGAPPVTGTTPPPAPIQTPAPPVRNPLAPPTAVPKIATLEDAQAAKAALEAIKQSNPGLDLRNKVDGKVLQYSEAQAREQLKYEQNLSEAIDNYAAQVKALKSSPKKINSKSEYDSLKPGTLYIDSTGKIARKK